MATFGNTFQVFNNPHWFSNSILVDQTRLYITDCTSEAIHTQLRLFLLLINPFPQLKNQKKMWRIGKKNLLTWHQRWFSSPLFSRLTSWLPRRYPSVDWARPWNKSTRFNFHLTRSSVLLFKRKRPFKEGACQICLKIGAFGTLFVNPFSYSHNSGP